MQIPAIPTDERERLVALHELKILDTPPEERFDRITRLTSVIFDAPICLISLIDSNRQWFKSACGLGATETKRDISFCGHAILGDGALVVCDAREDDRFFDNPLVVGEPHIRFYAGYPLRADTEHKVGTLCLIDRKPREFSENDRQLLADVAHIIEDQISFLDVIELQGEIREAHHEIAVAHKELELRNAILHRVFGTYVSTSVFKHLLSEKEAPVLGGEKRTVTIVMSDLRDFTPLTETLAPESVVRALNNYLGSMVSVITQHEGMLDNIIGDGLLIVFNGLNDQPDHIERAVQCAIDMQAAMDGLNARVEVEGLPALSMGIGINTGDVIVGNIGSEHQMKHSVIGRAVNVAARIVGHSIPGQILVSEATRDGIDSSAKVTGGLRVQLKGIREPVTIFEIAQVDTPKSD